MPVPNTPPSPADLARLLARVEQLERRFRAAPSRTLDGLEDVDADYPTNLDLLGYDATRGKWTNVVAPTGGSGLSVGATDQFLDLSGVAISSGQVNLPWVANTDPAYVAGPGNLVPDTLGGNPVARVTAAGIYVIKCWVGLTVDTDIDVRVDGAVFQTGTGLIKTLDADNHTVTTGFHSFGQVSAALTFPFAGEVGDIVFVAVTTGASATGTGQLVATALSIT